MRSLRTRCLQLCSSSGKARARERMEDAGTAVRVITSGEIVGMTSRTAVGQTVGHGGITETTGRQRSRQRVGYGNIPLVGALGGTAGQGLERKAAQPQTKKTAERPITRQGRANFSGGVVEQAPETRRCVLPVVPMLGCQPQTNWSPPYFMGMMSDLEYSSDQVRTTRGHSTHAKRLNIQKGTII